MPLVQSTLIAACIVCVSAASHTASGQSQRPCDTPEGKAFDFWIGEWEVTWPAGQGGTPVDSVGRGTSVISRVLGDCTIQERFRSSGGFEGISLSTFHARTRKWHQTWVDSRGGYLTFSGTFHDGMMEMRTDAFTGANGHKQINRMIWKDIEENSMTWYWQRSIDGGTSWENLWVIRYERIRPTPER